MTAHIDGAGLNATLQIAPTGDGVVTVGGTAMLIDASGRLLYSIEMTVNRESNEVHYRQATEDDYVAWTVLETDEHVSEAYDANGVTASFDYPQIADEAKARAINQIEHGLPVAHLPERTREYANQAAAFRAYYLPFANNSLSNNPAGELLIQLLASPVGAYAISGRQPEQMNKFAQAFCNLVTSCATFLCRIFPGSGLCSACTGAALACAIFETMSPFAWGVP
jgi:hypothetical protein